MDVSIAVPSQLAPPYVPVEVCEHVIDMLYSGIDLSEELKYVATLRSCSLVCQAWRIRAQRMLFLVLRAGKHLEAYVHEVVLSGRYLQTTASILSPFLAIFQAGKLPNLHRLAALAVLDSTKWYPSAGSDSASPKAKPLPHIPLHSRFPTLLSAFTTVSTLQLEETRFQSFGEFVRMVSSLPNLENLGCTSVRWNTLGRTSLLTEQTGGVRARPLRKLQDIEFWNSGSHAAKWLLSACGPNLKGLKIDIPLGDGPGEEANSVELDLSLFPVLGNLTIMPTSAEFSTNPRWSDLLKAILTSWKPQCLDPRLEFRANYHSCRFTRQEFVPILEVVGVVTESWRVGIANSSGEVTSYRFFVVVYERKSHREAWIGRFLAAFPTWLRLGGLIVEITEPPDSSYVWKRSPSKQSSKAKSTSNTSSSRLQLEASSSRAQLKKAKRSKPSKTHYATA
ncbi:hypothetical protein V8D89_001336 [Ganoderma adspersum]